MTNAIEEASSAYCALIHRLAHAWPGHYALHEFVNLKRHESQSPAKITIVTISPGSLTGNNCAGIDLTDIDGTIDLIRMLGSGIQSDGRCRLFIVENVCPRTIALLGGCYDVDPQVFGDHLNVGSWYYVDTIADRIPALPSSQKVHDFLQLRYIDARTVEKFPTSTSYSAVEIPEEFPQGGLCLPPECRNFLDRPGLYEQPAEVMYSHNISREALVSHLKARFIADSPILDAVITDVFLMLSDVYRFSASSWIVVSEYINRELATIEYILEKETPSFQELESYLKDLYILRRRCTMYHELISGTKDQCHCRGQQSWPRGSTSDLAIVEAQNLEDDFTYVQMRMRGTGQRTEKNINLLTALVAISEGKQGLHKNHSITRLTLVATIVLPFSTVAAVLGMPGSFAVGATTFWVFWVTAIPLIAVIVVLFYAI